MYTNLYGCDVYNAYYQNIPQMCDSPQGQFIFTALFFIVFILFGSLVLLTLFIGVVSTSMTMATQQQETEIEIDAKIVEYMNMNDMDTYTVDYYREVFDYVHVSEGSFMERDELKLGFKRAKLDDLTDESFEKLWSAVDVDGSGNMDFSEFLLFIDYIKAEIRSIKTLKNTGPTLIAAPIETAVENTHELESENNPEKNIILKNKNLMFANENLSYLPQMVDTQSVYGDSRSSIDEEDHNNESPTKHKVVPVLSVIYSDSNISQ